MDIMDITIEEDGTIKVMTEGVSSANHTSADDLLALLEEELGGERVTVKRTDKKALVHRHGHVKHSH